MSDSRPQSPKPTQRKEGKVKGLLKEQLELIKVKLDDGRTRYTIRAIEETLSFDKGFYVFVRAIQMLKASNTGTVVVGVAGPSGSGKTAFSEKIKNLMPGVAVISMDMYNDGTKVIDDNFDDPRLTDYDLLLQNLADLRDGKEVQIPIYDFRSSRRVGYRPQPVPEARVVLLEGIYALSDRLRPLMDLRVSITGGVHFDLVKRVMRDIQRSGQGPEEIIQQITDTVYPMYKAFIEPDLQTAHLRVVNSFNPFSGFMNATYILKSKKVPSLETVTKTLEAYGQVSHRREVDIYDIYLLPPNEDPETCQSWLRMRNRDGRYSLMFEEWVSEGPFIISPRIAFEVSVRILGGLMALGYEIGTIMKRTSVILSVVPNITAVTATTGSAVAAANGECDGATAATSIAAAVPPSPSAAAIMAAEELLVKLDDVGGLGRFMQILGRDRERVAALGRDLGLEGTYIPRSYIEQVQLERLTAEFQTVTEDWKKKFSTRSGEVVMPDSVSGLTSPGMSHAGNTMAYSRSMSYQSQVAPALSTSAPVSNPVLIPGPQSANSRPGSRVGSVQPNGGLLSQQLGGTTPHNNRADGLGPLHIPPANSPSPDNNRSVKILAELQERLEEMGGSNTEQITTLQTQLDAMVEQHRETNAQLAQLAAATSQLAHNVQATLAAATVNAASPRPTYVSPLLDLMGGASPTTALMAGLGLGAAVTVGILIGRVVAGRP
ncbi:hypothetical protein Vretimale_12820 [Volvox reticuliferus]|uniref:Uncharacterized protein n=1 Tax=Volvox reticuliferus TaxID=1737510 RepID=A0A8J4FLF7_9CHLO|nr:hypothetical protein Vretifemale_9198 [Volvox reticuliferus]GIM08860.1 hypothetical protein Vretimale_12820 [Volvox reticuliferus]